MVPSILVRTRVALYSAALGAEAVFGVRGYVHGQARGHSRGHVGGHPIGHQS